MRTGDRLRLFFVLFSGAVFAACGSQNVDGIFEPAPVTLIVYQSPTVTVEFKTPTPAATQTLLPSATPTQTIYQVQSGDTLTGIAVKFDVTLDDLRFANPEIDPRFLSVGVDLIIPTGGSSPVDQGLPTPTPAISSAFEPECYPTRLGGAVCLWLMQNNQPYALENISAVIRLFDENGDQVASQEAAMLLNVLPSGRVVPLIANFPPPLGDWSIVQGEVISALEVASQDDRYVSVEFQISDVTIIGLHGQVQGKVFVSDPNQSAGQVWVVAAAYDRQGRPVGVRRWEHDLGLAGGDTLDVAIDVYSLGPAIDRIEVLVEGRP